MTNFAQHDDDIEPRIDRENAFQWAGNLLALSLAGRDVAEYEGLFLTKQSERPEWTTDVAAIGYLTVAIAYCVDIAVDNGWDYLDEGQLGDHISYVIESSGMRAESDDAGCLALLRDEVWVGSMYDRILTHHWPALATLVEKHWAGGVSDDVLEGALSVDAPSVWVQSD